MLLFRNHFTQMTAQHPYIKIHFPIAQDGKLITELYRQGVFNWMEVMESDRNGIVMCVEINEHGYSIMFYSETGTPKMCINKIVHIINNYSENYYGICPWVFFINDPFKNNLINEIKLKYADGSNWCYL